MTLRKPFSTLIVFFLFLLSTNAFSITNSSDVIIGPVKIGPGQSATIPLDKLYTGENYHLTCAIRNDNSSATEMFTRIRLHLAHIEDTSRVYIDGCDRGHDKNMLLHFQTKGSVLKITDVRTHTAIQIRNLDQTDTIAISGCVARLMN